MATFGSDTPLGRAGEPEKVATSFVFLASDDSAYMTGQVLHPNGGRVVNGYARRPERSRGIPWRYL